MKPLIQCIPSFSEGKDPQIVKAIKTSIKNHTGVHVANIQMDSDHNRSVITFMGGAEAVSNGAYEGCRKAQELIDLREQTGVHPRIGATDIIPIVPLWGYSIRACVNMAHRLGKVIYRDLKIPVYFYDYAALRPKRKELPKIRKGGFESLKKNIAYDSYFYPDEGTNKIHLSAGAVAIGVRDVLVAFNINLGTTDIKIGRKIANRIREKNNGLPGVRALGLFLPQRQQVQISMNLTNYKKTNMVEAFRAVTTLSQSFNVEVLDSELVGLAPKEAMGKASPKDLRMKQIDSSQFLEDHTQYFS